MRTLVIAAAAFMLLPGCGKPFNEQIGLVGTDPLPALAAAADTEPLSGTRSLQGWDRRHWPVLTVQVPLKQVAHYPTYVSTLHLQQDGGPWDERFPTAAAALRDRADPGADALDGVIDPAWAVLLLVWAPVDMVFVHWPWTGVRGPREPYDRVPSPPATDLGPWIDVGQSRIQWTDEGAGAMEPQ